MTTIDLTRCSWCGRTGTLTSLSAGNRCVFEDDCHEARREVIERAAAIAGEVAPMPESDVQ